MDNVKSIIELLLEEDAKCRELNEAINNNELPHKIINLKASIRIKRSEIAKCFNSDLKYNVD